MAETLRRAQGEEVPPNWFSVRDCIDEQGALRELSRYERDALVARIRDHAKGWFERSASHSPFAAVPQRESDEFGSWLADNPGSFGS